MNQKKINYIVEHGALIILLLLLALFSALLSSLCLLSKCALSLSPELLLELLLKI